MVTLTRSDVFDIEGEDFTGHYKAKELIGGNSLHIALNRPSTVQIEDHLSHDSPSALFNDVMDEGQIDRLCSAARMAWRQIQKTK